MCFISILIVSYPYSYIHRRCLLLMYNHVISDVGCNTHIAYIIHVPTRGQPMRLGDSHVTEIYIYEWTFRKGQVFFTQSYCMYMLVNSGDLRIKLDFYYMRTCISFITVKTATNKVNVTLQHETWCQEL